MGTSVFLDVGTHDGQTLTEVTKPRWTFDRIVGFEPMPAQWQAATARFPQVAIHPYGLSNMTGQVDLYGDNSHMEASVWPTHRDADRSVVTRVTMIAASDYFAYGIPPDAVVTIKLNCEGSEVAILDDLIDGNCLDQIANVMIDFDVRKCAGQESEEARILARLAAAGFDRYSLCEDVMRGKTHQDRIAAWLGGLT